VKSVSEYSGTDFFGVKHKIKLFSKAKTGRSLSSRTFLYNGFNNKIKLWKRECVYLGHALFWF